MPFRRAPLALAGLLALACAEEVEDRALGPGPDVPGVAGDVGFGPCDRDEDCPSGLICLFWENGCARGQCGVACPTVYDAAIYFVCGCDGVWHGGGCTRYPWSHTGFDPDAGLSTPGRPCTPRVDR